MHLYLSEKNRNNPLPLKKIFLIVLISLLSVMAFIAVAIFIRGELGELEAKILLSTLSIGAYSFTGLGNFVLWNRREHTLADIGIIASLLGLIVALYIIWASPEFSYFYKWFFLFSLLSISSAQSSLLLAMCSAEKKIVKTSLSITFFFIIVVTVMLTYLIFGIDYINEEKFFRLLGACAVLDILGTIITPLLKRF